MSAITFGQTFLAFENCLLYTAITSPFGGGDATPSSDTAGTAPRISAEEWASRGLGVVQKGTPETLPPWARDHLDTEVRRYAGKEGP